MKSCAAVVKVQLMHGATNISVDISNFRRTVLHSPSKKRRFIKSHPANAKILHDLSSKSAFCVRIENADKEMDEDDIEPSHLPSSNALRIIKHRIDEPRGPARDTSSRFLALMDKYPDCIHEFGVKPFFLFYLSPLQNAWYRIEWDYGPPIICIDATGLGLRLAESGQYIFFYAIVGIGRTKAVHLASMLSQKHTANFIAYWLFCWVRHNRCPKEVVIDESAALLAACVMVFTHQKFLNEYLSASMLSLLHKQAPPTTYIRIDRPHFMRSLLRNKVLKRLDFRVRHMYMNIFGYFIQAQDLDEIETTMQEVFVICRNQYVTAEVVHAVSVLKALSVKCSIDFPDTESEETKNGLPNKYKVRTDYKSTVNYEWVMRIYNSAATSNSGKNGLIDNIYYCPSLEEYLIYQFVRMPLWSNMMCAKYKSRNFTATSSACEELFKDMKHNLNLKSRRPDMFVSKHLALTSGIMKLSLSDQEYRNRKVLEENNGLNDKSDHGYRPDFMFDKENWKDKTRKKPVKNRQPKRGNRSQYSILNLDAYCQRVPLLANGSQISTKGHAFILSNTCAFDCIFSIYAAAFLDFQSIRVKFETNDCNFAKFVTKTINGKKNGVNEARSRLLFEIYSTNSIYKHTITSDENVTMLNCFTAAEPLFRRLAVPNEILYSVKKEKTCRECEQNDITHDALVPLILDNLRLDNVEKNVRSAFLSKRSRCSTCGTDHERLHALSPIIVLDVERFVNGIEKISNLQQVIQIDGHEYKLYGCIEHIASKLHYVAHIQRKNEKWETYDNLSSIVKCNDKNTFEEKEGCICMLFYVSTDLFVEQDQ